MRAECHSADSASASTKQIRTVASWEDVRADEALESDYLSAHETGEYIGKTRKGGFERTGSAINSNPTQAEGMHESYNKTATLCKIRRW